MKKWFLEVVQDFDGSYYANLTIDAKPVKDLPEYVDYNTLRNAIKEMTGLEILKKKDMIFQQNGRKKYAYIDATQQRKDCRVTLDEIYKGWEPDFDSAWITVYKDVLGYQDDKDNLTEILVPKQWLINALQVVVGVEDYKQWRDEYTADDTITIATKALRENVILDCSDENISFKKDIKDLSGNNKDVLQDLRDVVVLICTHETGWGADSFVSFHPSEKEAEKHADVVMEDVGYYEERDDESFQIDIKHYDFSQFPNVKSLNNNFCPVQEEKDSIASKSIYERAVDLVNETQKQPNGDDMLYICAIIHKLSAEQLELSREELLKLTERIYEASVMSDIPLLTAERVDAVCSLLTVGINSNKSPEFPSLFPEQAKNFLLNCDMGVFVNLVDQISLNNQRFYAPDKDDITGQDIAKVEKAVKGILAEPMALEDVISMAEEQKDEKATGNKIARDLGRDF